MIGRNKEIYNSDEGECNIKINIFTDGINCTVGVYAKVMQSYLQTELDAGESLPEPEPKTWW